MSTSHFRLWSQSTTRASALALAGAAVIVGGSTDADAALKRPGKLRVDRVGVHRIELRWEDRSRGERRYEVRHKGRGTDRWTRRALPRNRERVANRGLPRGTVFVHQVRACRGERCSRWSPRRRQATLLRRFNGPHARPRCSILPPGDELNRDVSSDPVHPRSAQIVARIDSMGGDDLHPDFGSRLQWGIPYVVVPGDQPGVPIRFTAFGSESDRGPYPIPPRMPVEGTSSADGDRHVLVIRRPRRPGGACKLYELYRSFYRDGPRNRWTGGAGAVFDLGSRLPQRPRFWTSADAAGLPIFPGLVTYEEVASGEIDHAIRVTFEVTRRSFISPARHWASDDCHPSSPPMGLRLRLRAGHDISGITGDARVIARALKRYGMIVADNGSNWFISGSTDRRWRDANLNQLKSIPGTAFQVLAPRGRVTDGCS